MFMVHAYYSPGDDPIVGEGQEEACGLMPVFKYSLCGPPVLAELPHCFFDTVNNAFAFTIRDVGCGMIVDILRATIVESGTDPLAVPAPHLLSLLLPRQSSPHWKSQIAHLDVHNFVFGIYFQIHSVILTSLVSIHLLIHLSTHLSYHPRSRHPSLLHSFTPGSNPFQQILSTIDFFYLLDCLTITGLDRTYHAYFSFCF